MPSRPATGCSTVLAVGPAPPCSWHQDPADGSTDYGNEKEAAIKDGLVKREELFLVSKLWNTFHDVENVEPIAKKQLAD
jgi:hypothetical protein